MMKSLRETEIRMMGVQVWTPIISCMEQRWFAVTLAGLVAGGVMLLIWRGPVSVLITIAGLGMSWVGLQQARRAEQRADTDLTKVVPKLANAVRTAEMEARRQLLGGHDRTMNVQFSFRPAPAHNAAGAERKGSLEEVVSYYRELLPQRMVITGAAGSGKTVLAVELILGLLECLTEGDPVPIRISAVVPGVTPSTCVSVEEWLTRYLRDNYKLSRVAAQHIVMAQMVLPVVDGLDEMDSAEEPGYASRAGLAIQAFNFYLNGRQKAAMILTCRNGHYESLEQAHAWVHDAARVQLQPVKQSSIRDFLARRGDDERRWKPVFVAMRRQAGAHLAEALSTPWRLALAATVYEQRHPVTGEYIHDPARLTQLDTDELIRDHLLSLLIPATTDVQGSRYAPRSVHRWLGTLACYLDVNSNAGPAKSVAAGRRLSGSDVVLHELWPLAGRRMPRALTAGLMAVALIPVDVWVLAHARSVSASSWFAVAILFALGTLWNVYQALAAWPAPRLISGRHLKTRLGRRQLAIRIAFGVALGLISGLLSAAIVQQMTGQSSAVVLELIRAGGLAVGIVSGLLLGLQVNVGEYFLTRPQDIIRNDLIVGFATGLGLGAVAGLMGDLVAGVEAGLLGGLIFGVVCWLWTALAGWRYLALLACTRRLGHRWLPWRLGRFLYWCYEARLIRAAGIGYQFRHRELQEYLSRTRAADAGEDTSVLGRSGQIHIG